MRDFGVAALFVGGRQQRVERLPGLGAQMGGDGLVVDAADIEYEVVAMDVSQLNLGEEFDALSGVERFLKLRGRSAAG